MNLYFDYFIYLFPSFNLKINVFKIFKIYIKLILYKPFLFILYIFQMSPFISISSTIFPGNKVLDIPIKGDIILNQLKHHSKK